MAEDAGHSPPPACPRQHGLAPRGDGEVTGGVWAVVCREVARLAVELAGRSMLHNDAGVRDVVRPVIVVERTHPRLPRRQAPTTPHFHRAEALVTGPVAARAVGVVAAGRRRGDVVGGQRAQRVERLALGGLV